MSSQCNDKDAEITDIEYDNDLNGKESLYCRAKPIFDEIIKQIEEKTKYQRRMIK